jgi:glycosyltransferase involved in cell wall biosynthesis
MSLNRMKMVTMGRENMNLIAIYLPQVVAGGAENNFAKIASALARRGWSVEILVSNARQPFSPHLDKSVKVIELKSRFGRFRLFALLDYLNKNKPIVLMSGLEGPNLLSGLIKRLKLTKTRVVVSLRNRDDLEIADYPSGIKKTIFEYFYDFAIRGADHIIVIANELKNHLVNEVGIPSEKITVIYNPIMTEKVRNAAAEPITEDWFSGSSEPYLLSVGRLELQKDYPTLFKALTIVRREFPVKLLILGEGTERANLEAMVKSMGLENVVRMPGFTSNPFRFMKRAKVFVFPSKHEGFGNVLLEAMACGVPIVSTDCPAGPREILEGGEWGSLVAVGDVKALADAIIETLRHPPVLNYDERLSDFDFERTVEKYMTAMGLPLRSSTTPPEGP